MAANRFGQMAKSALPGVAGGMPPRPPRMAAKAPKAAPAAKAVPPAVMPAAPRRNMVKNLGKFAHPPKPRR